MSDKKQSDVKQPGWLHEAKLWVKEWVIEQWPMPFLGVLVVIIISCCICSPYLSPERRATNNDHTFLEWYLIGLAAIGVVVLCIPQIITSNPKKYFITRVFVTGITGGAFALLLPIAVKSTTTGVGGLRHSILLATGGLLAILTLGETRRKNDIDKRKNKQEKKKNDKDHRRQVRAERRERYAKAVEQLGDEKAPIRMGGVYTLVGLVDEWLEDESIDKYEDRLKEGQVIINNLCAYIRSPFTLASHYDELSQDTPTTEVIYKDIQQKSHKKWQIISNNLYACIRSRFTPDSRHDELSQDSYIAFYKDKEQEFYADKANLKSEADVRRSIIKEIHDRLQCPEENTPGIWSDFEYNFSRSIFFYPVDFRNSKYNKPVNFSGSIYYEEATFSNSAYYSTADFHGSTYYKNVYFKDSAYYKDVRLGGIYNMSADFSKSTYYNNLNITGNYKYTTDFSESLYCGYALFEGLYKYLVDFRDSIYYKTTFLIRCEEESIFIGSIFFKEFNTSNSADGFLRYSHFIDYSPQFYDHKKLTLFGSHENDFYVNYKHKYINIGEYRNIPLGCNALNQYQEKSLRKMFKDIKSIKGKILFTKTPSEKLELSKKLWSLNKELHEWREEATTVKVEDVAAEDTES